MTSIESGLLHIGFQHYIRMEAFISFHPVKSAPIRKMIAEADRNQKVFDACMGRKTRTVFFTVTGQLILSSIDSKVLRQRCSRNQRGM